MYRVCSCTADEVQRNYPERTEMIHLVFNFGVSHQPKTERLAAIDKIVVEQAMTEDDMIAILDDLSNTLEGCIAQIKF